MLVNNYNCKQLLVINYDNNTWCKVNMWNATIGDSKLNSYGIGIVYIDILKLPQVRYFETCQIGISNKWDWQPMCSKHINHSRVTSEHTWGGLWERWSSIWPSTTLHLNFVSKTWNDNLCVSFANWIRQFWTDPTIKIICGVGSAHNGRVAYVMTTYYYLVSTESSTLNLCALQISTILGSLVNTLGRVHVIP